MTTTTERWLGWTTDTVKARLEDRLASLGASTTAMDCILSKPATYSTRLHAVDNDFSERVGGRAYCGVTVPPRHPNSTDPAVWWNSTDGVPKCRRCLRKATA